MNWYEIEGIDTIDSPSIVLYEKRLDENLAKMLAMVANDTSKLMPHLKTNKMPEVIQKMISLGIKNFKASTIAEAEMAAKSGAESVLIVHQLVGPKTHRFLKLIETFPNTQFSTLIDNLDSLNLYKKLVSNSDLSLNLYIDINSGMNRSGILIGSNLDKLIVELKNTNNIIFKGLHVYDGHLRSPNFNERKKTVEIEIAKTMNLFRDLKKANNQIEIVCGGTPTFTSHLTEDDRICSPGTCVFWDWGYNEKLVEQEFNFAALLITRVISKPTKGIITIDLGHKAVSAENPIDKRVRFLNLDGYTLVSQSEEHGVLEVENWDDLEVGAVLYGVPYHICPTVNLYDSVSVIRKAKKVAEWEITARKRKITI